MTDCGTDAGSTAASLHAVLKLPIRVTGTGDRRSLRLSKDRSRPADENRTRRDLEGVWDGTAGSSILRPSGSRREPSGYGSSFAGR